MVNPETIVDLNEFIKMLFDEAYSMTNDLRKAEQVAMKMNKNIENGMYALTLRTTIQSIVNNVADNEHFQIRKFTRLYRMVKLLGRKIIEVKKMLGPQRTNGYAVTKILPFNRHICIDCSMFEHYMKRIAKLIHLMQTELILENFAKMSIIQMNNTIG